MAEESQSFTVATGTVSADIADWTKIGVDLTGSTGPTDKSLGDQVLRFSAWANASSGSGIIAVAVVRGSSVIWYDQAAVASSATRRQALDNASGDYHSSVTFTKSGNDTVDLLGAEQGDEVWAWVTSLTTLTSLDVYASRSKVV